MTFDFLVTVFCDTEDEADAVLAERLPFEPYESCQITWRPILPEEVIHRDR